MSDIVVKAAYGSVVEDEGLLFIGFAASLNVSFPKRSAYSMDRARETGDYAEHPIQIEERHKQQRDHQPR